MRKVLSILLLRFCVVARAQLYLELLYPNAMLQTNLQQARTLGEKIGAAGIISLHYKETFNNSLVAFYLQQVHGLAAHSSDDNLKAEALWWDAACSSATYITYEETKSGTTKAYGARHRLRTIIKLRHYQSAWWGVEGTKNRRGRGCFYNELINIQLKNYLL